MPGTVTTTERFSMAKYLSVDMDREVQQRVKAGAIGSNYKSDGNEWILVTVWNVIGENDS